MSGSRANQYMILHQGFETPTPEIMAAWGQWFESIRERTVENVGLRPGRQISRAGASDLSLGPDAFTGFTIITAESFEEASAVAARAPIISAVRVYELRRHGR